MQIAVTGTHSVGKTTLTKLISDMLKIPVIGEQARELLLTKYNFEEVDKDLKVFKLFQSDILDSQIKLEEEFRKAGESFVVDRTPLDSLAYVRERLTASRDKDMQYYYAYRNKVSSFMKRNHYNRIYFIRYDKIFNEDDGLRNLNPLLMETIDSIIDSELKTLSTLSIREIRTTERWERADLIQEDIRYHLTGEIL